MIFRLTLSRVLPGPLGSTLGTSEEIAAMVEMLRKDQPAGAASHSYEICRFVKAEISDRRAGIWKVG